MKDKIKRYTAHGNKRWGTHSPNPFFPFYQNEHIKRNNSHVTVGHSEGIPTLPSGEKPFCPLQWFYFETAVIHHNLKLSFYNG